MPAENLQQVPQWFPNMLQARIFQGNPLYQTAQNTGNRFENYGPGSQNPNITDPSSQGFLLQNGQISPATSGWMQQYGIQGPGSGNTLVPAGQPGSPYPSALPLNSFEQAIGEAKQAMADANASNEKRYKQALSINHQQGEDINTTFAGVGTRLDENTAANQAAGESIRAANKAGYDAAEGQLTGYGDAAKAEALRSGASRSAVAGASARSRGLFNSTVLDSLQRREREQTDRNVNQIGESVAGLKSGLAERRGSASTNVEQYLQQLGSTDRTNRAQLDMTGLNARNARLSERNQIIIGRQDNAPNPADIASLIANREVGQASARAQGNASSNALLGSIFGSLASVGGSLGGAAILAPALSDRRAKKDIHKVRDNPGKQPDEYTFRYKDKFVRSGKAPKGKFRGRMAQEVEREHPEKVVKGRDGLKRLVNSRPPRKVGK